MLYKKIPCGVSRIEENGQHTRAIIGVIGHLMYQEILFLGIVAVESGFLIRLWEAELHLLRLNFYAEMQLV